VAVARDAVAAVEAAKGSPVAERRRSHSYSGKRSGLSKAEKGDKLLAATDKLDGAQREAAAHDASPWFDMGVV
jgi:molybdenum-dependent DNA-binding transcriptional regulator ModE